MLATKQLGIAMRSRLAHAFERLAKKLRGNEPSLREKGADLESIIYRTPFMLVRFDRDQRYRFISRAYLELTGRRLDNVIGRRLPDIMDEKNYQIIRPHIEKVLQGSSVEFEREVYYPASGPRFLHIVYTPETDAAGAVTGFIVSMLDITERQRAEQERVRAAEAEKMLVRELEHRTNNLLAVIQAIANRSLSGQSALAEIKNTFEARLRALARANRQLTRSNVSGVSLDEIVHFALEPFSARTDATGPDVMLGGRDAQNLSLAVHELATNATKYGALSRAEGHVTVRWSVAPRGDKTVLELCWRESGGPIVVPPRREGFGTALLKTAFQDVRFDYAKEGLNCALQLTLSNVSDGHEWLMANGVA
jgi:PAS domain S-box-containing protein